MANAFRGMVINRHDDCGFLLKKKVILVLRKQSNVCLSAGLSFDRKPNEDLCYYKVPPNDSNKKHCRAVFSLNY
jgi:hypothetical protein